MDNPSLERYSRQILVPGFDLEAQERLERSRIVLVGCGGLGVPLALYLVGMGIGEITVVDHDRIEASNLPRQVAYTETDIGLLKVEVLAERLRAMNSQVQVFSETGLFDTDSGGDLLAGKDLVVDATDNHEARLAIDVVSRKAGLPWVMASAVQMAGQIVAFSKEREEGCYHCLAPGIDRELVGACARLGVLSPVVGAVAMEQALKIIAILTDIIPARWGSLDVIDYRNNERRTLQLTKRSDCPNCSVS
jgi:molybdopterin/thiamine biosynthesis adenylyltransferase